MEKQSKKQQQIAGIIQKEFSSVLQKDGSFIYGDALVTVMRVRMSADMGIAYIYLSVYNALYKQGVIKDLWDNLPRLRLELSRRIGSQMRRMPLLKFFIDDTLDTAEHIDHLFAELNANNPVRSMKEALDAKNSTQQDTDDAE